MSINLKKGQKIDLTKGGSGLSRIMVGLGWDEAQPAQGGGAFGLFKSKSQPKYEFDCDASVILLNEMGKLYGSNAKDCLVYFGNLKHSSESIIHNGDNLTGAGDGDDEQITVDLSLLPTGVDKLVFVVNIYDGEKRNQHFGMIENAFIRLVDLRNGSEICRFNLTEDYSGMTGMIVGEIYRYKGEWKFNAIGQPVKDAGRLQSLVNLYA